MPNMIKDPDATVEDTSITLVEAYERGRADAAKERAPLFRSTRAHGILANSDDALADDWNKTARRAYLDGYASFEAGQ
jgi:hypothetical protein